MDILAAISHYCHYSERCHADVRNKLYSLGCHKTEVEEYISKMIEVDLLNEERYARAFAGGKFRMLKWGRQKIIQQLKLKQVSDHCIKKALKEIDEDDYRSTLKKLALTKWKSLPKKEHHLVRKKKVQQYLLQKGFEGARVIEIINETIKSD